MILTLTPKILWRSVQLAAFRVSRFLITCTRIGIGVITQVEGGESSRRRRRRRRWQRRRCQRCEFRNVVKTDRPTAAGPRPRTGQSRTGQDRTHQPGARPNCYCPLSCRLRLFSRCGGGTKSTRAVAAAAVARRFATPELPSSATLRCNRRRRRCRQRRPWSSSSAHAHLTLSAGAAAAAAATVALPPQVEISP